MAWERSVKYITSNKVGGTKMHYVILHNYRASHVFLLRYDIFLHVHQILKYALTKRQNAWNSRTVEELKEEADCNSSVCK